MIPIPNVFPPAPSSISGDNVTASRFINSTPLLARAMRDLHSIPMTFNYMGVQESQIAWLIRDHEARTD